MKRISILFLIYCFAIFLPLVFANAENSLGPGVYDDYDAYSSGASDDSSSDYNSGSGEDWWSNMPDTSVGSGGRGFFIQSFGLPAPSNGIRGIIENALLWLLAILGFLGIIGFIISGIMYLVSAGDDDTIKKAKKAMTASITGVIIGLVGVVAIQAINSMLNAYQWF